MASGGRKGMWGGGGGGPSLNTHVTYILDSIIKCTITREDAFYILLDPRELGMFTQHFAFAKLIVSSLT